MNIEKKRVWRALGIGAVVTSPIVINFYIVNGWDVISALSDVLLVPAILIITPFLALTRVVIHPESDIWLKIIFLGLLPVMSFIFYSSLLYGVLTFFAKKK